VELNSKGLNVFLGGKQILKDLDMYISNKEFVGIIGPNGCGKSTLLRTFYRILKPKGGTILIDNKNIHELPLKETAKDIAVVSQHNDHDFDFSVLDMVLIGRTPHKRFLEKDNLEDYEIALDCLRKVEMQDFIDRKYNSLSGGEKQRIILARALAQKTRCLILDEPTNHLDIKYQLQFMSIAKSLNITIISAIHDLNIAALYCDKIYAMKDGKVVNYGTPREVITEKLIKELYDVDSKVSIEQETNRINIMYKPFYLKK